MLIQGLAPYCIQWNFTAYICEKIKKTIKIHQVSMPIGSQRGEQKGDIVISKLTDRVQC